MFKATNLLWFLLLFAAPAWAVPTYDNVTTTSGAVASGTSHVHAVGLGCTNPVVIVAIHCYYDQTVSAVTIGGNSATQIGSTVIASDAATQIGLWQRTAVSTGNNTVVTSFSGAVNYIAVSSVSYCGVDQTLPGGTPATNIGTDVTPTVNVTSATGELVVDAVAINNNATTFTVNGSQTQRANFGSGGSLFTGVSEKAGATTVTMSWTIDAGDYWAIIGVALKPAAAPPGGSTIHRNVIVFQ